jgi:gliding motility-associated-like protein
MASAPGNYVIANTIPAAGTCQEKVRTYTINITEPIIATISYNAPSYCKNISTLQTISQTGTSGGTYSVSPNGGLFIDVNTGAINPSLSSPGIYTVIYGITGSGVCTTANPTTQVEIFLLPNILQPAAVTVCNSYQLPTLTVGNYYSQSGGLGTPLDITVQIIAPQTTVYIYAINSNGCYNEKSFTVTINTIPSPTYTVTQSTCTTPTGSITVTSPVSAGGTLPTNLFISEVTDADAGSLTYVELFNGTGVSVDLANYKLKVYNNGNATTSCDLTLSGTMANNSVKVIAIGSTTNAGAVIPNLVFAACGGVNIDDNIRLTTLTNVEVDLWGRTDGVAFTPANQPGYTYRRNITTTAPSTTWDAADWTALDPENYTNVGSYSYSISNYQYSIDNGAFQSGTTFTNLAVGNHTLVVRDVTTGCFSSPVAVFIDPVNPIPSVTSFTYSTPVCQNATSNPIPDTSAVGFTTGGTFTSNPATGIDINPNTGEITLATTTSGTYIITYVIVFNPTTCQVASSSTFTIVINPIVTPAVGFSYNTTICQNAQPSLSPTLLSGFTFGGTFSTTTGLMINDSTGVINLATSTAGLYTITYAVNANTSICQVANSSTFNITINPVITPVTGFSYNTPFCPSDAAVLQSPITVTGFTNGGTFTSTTGLSIDALTGGINLNNSTPGNYNITYTITANPATCQVAGTNTTQVTIIAPVTIELTGGCQSVSYILTATPVNGSFVPETATYSWENASGIVVGTTQSIVVTVIGAYTVTVTVAGCETVSSPFSVDSIFCVIQKGISVNNDGLNDTFDLTGYDVKNLSIFNRLGVKIYSRNNYIDEWGGQSDNGDELPDGTYYYVIGRNNGETKTGWIYINRAQ